MKRKAIRRPSPSKRRGDKPNRPDTPAQYASSEQELQRPSEVRLTASIDENRSLIAELLGHSDDLVRHDLLLGGPRGLKCTAFYYQSMANSEFVHSHILQPLVIWARPRFYESDTRPSVDELRQRIVVATEIDTADSMAGVMDGLFCGHCALMVDGLAEALIFRAAGFETRAVSEPMNETSVRGPNEALVESIETSTSLIRRKYKSPHLVVKNLIIGDESRTMVRLMYDQHIAPPAIVREVERRLQDIKIDVILYSGTVEHLISDHPYALWPITERTERPDRIADLLTQGRIAVLIDGTAWALLVPATASGYFWTADDQAESFYFGSFVRVLRMFALVLSAFGTPVYVALATFHPEMIPLPLLLNIIQTQEGVPFPLMAIAFGMEFIIEVVREAGIRLPRSVGSAVSIVGAIVIGQAAITAGFAPAGLVVVVALSVISSFAIPDYGAAVAFRLLRFPALLAGALFGLYGVSSVAMLALFDMCSIKNFGVPFLAMYTPGRGQQLLGSLMIAPPRLLDPKRKLSYRDRYRAGAPPKVKSHIPWLEKVSARRIKRR